MLLLEVVGIALPSFAKKLVVEKILSVSCKFFLCYLFLKIFEAKVG